MVFGRGGGGWGVGWTFGSGLFLKHLIETG